MASCVQQAQLSGPSSTTQPGNNAPMYTLYWRAGTAAFAPQALLEEIGAPYEKVHIKETDAAQTSEAFRAVNPLGQVPALVLPDGTVMTESAAMTIYLADLNPELGLAPAPDDPARAVYLRWMVFMAAKLYQTFPPHLSHRRLYRRSELHTGDQDDRAHRAGTRLGGSRRRIVARSLFVGRAVQRGRHLSRHVSRLAYGSGPACSIGSPPSRACMHTCSPALRSPGL